MESPPIAVDRTTIMPRKKVVPLKPEIVKEGETLWAHVRNATEAINLSRKEVSILKMFLQNVVIPRLEPVEREVGGGVGWDDPNKHPLPIRERVADDVKTEQLNELHDARDVLNDLQRDKTTNPVPPLIPEGSQLENKFKPDRTWVLIIGNDNYTVRPLAGCANDAREVDTYVRQTLKINANNILKLENATRDEMVDALHTHFGKATNMGDALLFFYSGHGASYPLHRTAHSASGAAIEALCPTDRGPKDDGSGIIIQDISDRELNTIFSIHAARIGPNITSILDCCHSGGLQRVGISRFELDDEEEDEEDNQPGVRRVPPLARGLNEMLRKAEEDTRINWTALNMLPTNNTWKANTASHVLLAAAQDFERSMEIGGRGAFTVRLLKVLEHFPTKNFGYMDIRRCIGTVMLPNAQNPALLGDHADSSFLQIGY